MRSGPWSPANVSFTRFWRLENECYGFCNPGPFTKVGDTKPSSWITLRGLRRTLSKLRSGSPTFAAQVIANPPIRTATGALLLPFWRETRTVPVDCLPTDAASESAWLLVSLDDGASLEPRGRISTAGAKPRPFRLFAQ